MNKKILMLLVSVLAVAMLAVPVMAKPTKGQKTEVTLTMVATGPPGELDPDVNTGPVTHRHVQGNYAVTILIEDVPILTGELVADRKVVTVPQKEGMKWIFTDHYVITFNEVDGGFEGNGKVIMDGVYFTSTGIAWEKSMSYYLFHGTGDFEGQTLNFNHHWNPFGGGVPTTTGYWLKYEPQP